MSNNEMTKKLQTISVTQQTNGSYLFKDKNGFELISGETLPELDLLYETHGHLNHTRDNVILIHHALSTHSHICSSHSNPTPGWWESMVGPGKAIDTDQFYVICINNLGSCFGSSGPSSLHPQTRVAYGKHFPKLTIEDMVLAQHKLLQHLSIEKLYAVIGNSMGAMLSLAWAIYFPHSADRLISISSSYKTYPLNFVRHLIGREIILMDPSSHRKQGLKIARKLAHLDYRSIEELQSRFQDPETLMSYLDYNAQKFIDQFDADTYLCLTQAMDNFDASNMDISRVEKGARTQNPFQRITAKTLIVSVSSDTLFEPFQQKELAERLRDAGVSVDFIPHHSDRGHDAFYNDEGIGQYIKSQLLC